MNFSNMRKRLKTNLLFPGNLWLKMSRRLVEILDYDSRVIVLADKKFGQIYTWDINDHLYVWQGPISTDKNSFWIDSWTYIECKYIKRGVGRPSLDTAITYAIQWRDERYARLKIKPGVTYV